MPQDPNNTNGNGDFAEDLHAELITEYGPDNFVNFEEFKTGLLQDKDGYVNDIYNELVHLYGEQGILSKQDFVNQRNQWANSINNQSSKGYDINQTNPKIQQEYYNSLPSSFKDRYKQYVELNNKTNPSAEDEQKKQELKALFDNFEAQRISLNESLGMLENSEQTEILGLAKNRYNEPNSFWDVEVKNNFGQTPYEVAKLNLSDLNPADPNYKSILADQYYQELNRMKLNKNEVNERDRVNYYGSILKDEADQRGIDIMDRVDEIVTAYAVDESTSPTAKEEGSLMYQRDKTYRQYLKGLKELKELESIKTAAQEGNFRRGVVAMDEEIAAKEASLDMMKGMLKDYQKELVEKRKQTYKGGNEIYDEITRALNSDRGTINANYIPEEERIQYLTNPDVEIDYTNGEIVIDSIPGFRENLQEVADKALSQFTPVFDNSLNKIEAANRRIEEEIGEDVNLVVPENLSPHERFRFYYATLVKELQDMKKAGYDPMDDSSVRGIGSAYLKSLTGTFSDKENKAMKYRTLLQELAPIALNGSSPLDDGDESYIDRFAENASKVMVKELAGAADPLLMTDDEKERALIFALQGSGTMGSASDPLQSQLEEAYDFDENEIKRKDITNPDELANLIGTTGAFLVQFGAGSAVGGGALRSTRAGKRLLNLYRSAPLRTQIAHNSAIFKALQNSPRLQKLYANAYKGALKFGAGSAIRGTEYQTTGILFPSQSDEANFVSGVFGYAGEAAVNNLTKRAKFITPVIKKLFGNKAPQAVNAITKFGEKSGRAIGAGVGESGEEFMQEMSSILMNSKSGDFFEEYKKRFPEADDIITRLIIPSFIMGTAFGTGTQIGGTALETYEQNYNALPENQKVIADEMISEISKDHLQMQEEVVRTTDENLRKQDLGRSDVPNETFEVGDEVTLSIDPSSEVVQESVQDVVQQEGDQVSSPADSDLTQQSEDIIEQPTEDIIVADANTFDMIPVNDDSDLSIQESIDKVTGVTNPTFAEGLMKEYSTPSKVLNRRFQAYKQGYRAKTKEIAQIKNEIRQFVNQNKSQLMNLNPRLTKKLTDSITRIKDQSSLDKELDLIEGLMKDGDYDTKIREADSNKNKLKKIQRSKTLNPEIRSISKKLANINPKDVSDINVYNQIVSNIIASSKSPRAKKVYGEYFIINGDKKNYEGAQSFLERFEQKQQKIKEQNLTQEYFNIFGELPEGLNFEEINKAVDAIDNVDLDQAERQKAERIADNQAKRLKMEEFTSYKQLGITPEITKGLNKTQKEYMNLIKDVDPSLLSYKENVQLVNTIENFIVNGLDYKIGDIGSRIKGRLEAQKFKKKQLGRGITPRKIISFWDKNFQSLTELSTSSQKSAKYGSELKLSIGYDAKENGKALTEKQVDDFVNGYNKISKKEMKKQKDLNELKSRYRRGMYAYLIQVDPSSELSPEEQFQNRKELVKKSIDQYGSPNNTNLDSTKLATQQEVYDELVEPAEKGEDLKLSDSEQKIVSYFIDEFNKIKPEVFENARLYHGVDLSEYSNYLPIKIKTTGSAVTKQDLNEVAMDFITQNSVKDRRAGSTKERTENIGNNQYIDFDLDNSASKAYYSSLYDVNTSRHIKQMQGFLESPESTDVFGDETNKEVYKDALVSNLKSDQGYAYLNKAEKQIANVVNTVASVSAVRALGGITQYIKQTIPVLFNTAINLGPDISLLYENVSLKENPIFDKVSVGQRGALKSAMSIAPEDVIKSAEGKQLYRLLNKMGAGFKTGRDMATYFLREGDKLAARMSWISYYLKSLKDQNLNYKNLDWKQEAENINETAAAYANSMVSRTQAPSDTSEKAFLLSNQTGFGFSTLRNIIMPFGGFSANAKARLINDIRNISTKTTKEAKSEALRSFGATVAEQMVFNAIKIYGMYALYDWLTDSMLLATGNEPKEKDEDKEKEKKDRRFWSSTVKDLAFGGTPDPVSNAMTQGINQMQYQMTDKKKSFSEFERKDSFLERYTLGGNYGLYGILGEEFFDASDSWDLAVGDTYTKTSMYGDKEVKTDEDMRTLGWLAFVNNIMSLSGVNFNEFSNAAKKAKKEATKK